MKNQIRMITGIGTPIIHSSIERMMLLLVRGLQGPCSARASCVKK
jgi:hypothetical protein